MGNDLDVKLLYIWNVNQFMLLYNYGGVIMTFDELELKLIHLMSFPLKSQIKVDFDQDKKIFSLSVPIFRSGRREVPFAVRKYVEARKGMTFQPHATSYHHTEDVNQVRLVQEFPFNSHVNLRTQLVHFWDLAKTCNKMLCEIAAEEKLSLFEVES